MATQMEPLPLARCIFSSRILPRFAFLGLLSFLTIFLSPLSPASAQTSSQQYVYASAPGSPSPSSVPGFAKVSQTGSLNLLLNSPFSERSEGGLLAIDGQGKFLFVLNPTSDDISMFQIDPTTGSLSEVPASPFAVPPLSSGWFPPSQPLSMATEPSGQFLFVSYLLANGGDPAGLSAVASLAIDTSGSSPVLRLVASVLNQDSPIQLLTDSKGLRLYVGMGIGNDGTMQSGPEVYSIDGAGNLSFQGVAPNPENRGTDFAIDPQGRFVFAVGGLFAAHLVTCAISPVDGTLPTCGPPLDLSTTPQGMVVESSGHFLYLSIQDAVVFSVDQATGNATPVASLPGVVLSKGASVADPMGPYIYSTDGSTSAGGVHTYLVDQQTGNLTEILGSPFSPGVSVCCQGLAITGNPVQAVSGSAASIFPSTASNFTATAGFSSAPQIFSLVNIGNQLLTINSISISGADSSSFSQTHTCPAALSSNAHCSITITFNPATVGAFTANLQIADNAPGSPQTLVLNGTGIAPAPAVTVSPSAVSFPSINQGSSSAPQSLTVISSGNTTLHISSVSLSGPNPSDFSLTNNCTAPLAPASSCTISLVFSPAAPGQRTADLVITDDAQGSPQGVVLGGTGIAVLSALSLSPPAPSFPATTQGASSAPQTLTAVNSGNAPLQVSSISLNGSNASEFGVSSTCTAPLAPAASCSISLVFSPTASGQSSANLVIADDAPNSPQTIALSATANPAFSVAAASGSSAAASVSAGQPAQYQLQLTPSSGFAGMVGLSCSGAPLGAVCQVPASVSLAGGTATFTATVTTSGPAQLPPSAPLRIPPASRVPLPAPTLLALLFLLYVFFRKKNVRAFHQATRKNHLALYGALSATILCITFALAGCGGGSASITPPPPIVTPAGTSTITISLSATSSAGQPLQLQPIQLTLTVK